MAFRLSLGLVLPKGSFCRPLSTMSVDLDKASNTASSKTVTAGLIIIGDEILKGQTQDTNTHFLASRLHSLGIRVARVSTIPDCVGTIAEEVRTFSGRYDLVLTSGGIGPTHDDVTFEGVATAFEQQVRAHPDIVEFVKKWFKTEDLENPAFKLARVPEGASLNYGKDKTTGKTILYPLVSVRNVYVFPGIPSLLERAFDNLGERLFGGLAQNRFHVRECFVTDFETAIADRLNALVKAHPEATFGSYPEWTHNYYKTKITVETDSEELSEKIRSEISASMPTMKYDKEPIVNAWDKIQELLGSSEDPVFKGALKEAVGVVEKCFRDYKPEEVTVCFNGGKDCIVMLHLVYAYFAKEYPGKSLQTIYIKDKDPFQEVEDFISKTTKAYSLDALTLDGPMKPALATMLERRPSLRACVLGTRMGDPGSQYQSLFSPTDGDWPRVMRVNPILNWEYPHVWTFVRGLSLPYPGLYDRGYTSLGSVNNTSPNPALRYEDERGKEAFKPAYELKDGSLERSGRH